LKIRPSVTWLLAFAPIALALERAHVAAPLVFLAAALAIIPLAGLIVHGTEHLAEHTGPAIGGLLNATFGNLPEFIICVVALRAGLLEVVRASLIGAVLANVLLALGVAFLLGGARYHVMEYNPAAARTYATMMVLAVLTMALPSAFHRFLGTAAPETARTLDLGVSVVLLATYISYVVFVLRTHPEFFAPGSALEHDVAGGEAPGKEAHWSVGRAVGTLLAASLGAAWMSEVLVGAAEATGQALGMSEIFLGLVLLAMIGTAAESGSAIALARKNKPDLAVGIAMGSSIQIALFVTPLLALVSGLFAPEPLALSFSRLEIGLLFMGVLIGVVVASDGQATWFKGVQLIAVYLVIAASLYLLPELAP
jgi:Ca2+:H+ antiporter